MKMSESPDLEVIFESFLYKLPVEAINSVLQSSWHKKYFVLLRDSTSPRLCYYNKKPRTIHDPPKGVIELCDHYQVEHKSSVKGKEFVCLLKTALRDVYLAAEKEHIITLFTFFLMTQTKLQSALEAECFVVRPENSDDHRKIGSRSSMCLMHVSSWGITLALQVSKCILVQWPLRCIRTYESTGKGRFVLEVGNSAPTGSGSFAFNTRLGQDSIIYDRIDSQANQQAAMQDLMSSRDARSPMDLIAISYQGLASLTYVHSDSGSIAQSKRISRDIYDHLAEYLGSTTNILSNAATAASAPVNIPLGPPLPPVPGSRNLKESASRQASADKNLPSHYLHVGKKLSPSASSDQSASSASSSAHPLLSRAATSPSQASFANSAYDMERRESKNRSGDPSDYVLQYHNSSSLSTGSQNDVDSSSKPYVNASAVAQRQESRESNASDYLNMSGNKRQSDSSGNRPTSSNGPQQLQQRGGGAVAKADDKMEANAAVYSYAQTPDFTRLSSRSSMPESVAVARAETELQQTATTSGALNSAPATGFDSLAGMQLGQIAASAAVGNNLDPPAAANRVADDNGMSGAEVRASLGGGGGGGERESRQQADNAKLAPGIKMSAKSRVFSRKSAPDTTEV